MRLNLNDNIRVKLTEHGKDIYYHQYDRTNKLLGREVCKPSYPKVDEDGYTTFQLWCFIELYGIHMGMTMPNVIEPLDIVFDEPTIEPERKTDGDTISRQAAIDEITEYGSGDTIYMSVAEFKRRIEHLTPAQPEIIRCQDCKYASPNGVYGCRLERFSAHDEGTRLFADDYCSKAERRTDD